MAKKKFLIENGAQVWPITRMDCIYTEDGKNLANLHYASKNFVLDDCLGGKKLRYVTKEEYNNLTDEQKNDEGIIWNIIDTEIITDLYATKDDLATEKNRAETAEKANSDAIEKIKEEMIHDFIDENDLDIIMADIENE